MQRVYAIGDIHGCASELATLLDALPIDESDTVVFLGDYIDRGPASKDVLSIALAFDKAVTCKRVFLKGNHEDMFLAYMEAESLYGRMFLPNGGTMTLESYGLDIRTDGPSVRARIPAEHLGFLHGLSLKFETDEWLFVHAGVHPLRSLAEQREEDLLWIRDEFLLHPHCIAKTVVFGHTPLEEVWFAPPSKIGLDTGLVYGNKLSCLELVEQVLYQVQKGEQWVRKKDLRTMSSRRRAISQQSGVF